MRLAFLTLAILALALVAAPTVFAQGAITSVSSFTEPALFADVSCIGNDDGKPVRGVLNFDPGTQVRCEAADGAGFTIAYAAVTRLVLHKGENADTSSRFSFHELLPRRHMLKALEADRFLTIYFNDAEGHARSSMVRLDNKNWQILVAVAENKTGRIAERHAKGDNWNWNGSW